MKKLSPTLFLAALLVIVLGAATVGPFAPSPFTTRTGTNTTASAWLIALGAPASSGGGLTNATISGSIQTGLTNSDLTASRVLVSGASKQITNATPTTTEINYVSGVTSALQTQLNSKVSNSAGYATNLSVSGLTNLDLTASTVPYLSSAKKLTSSAVTPTELGYVSGVTSALQTQLTGKASAANLTTVSNAQVTTDGKLAGYVTNLGGLATNLSAAGITVSGGQTNTHLTASRVVVTDGDKALTSSGVTTTTLDYLDATSSVQTQLDTKPTVALTNLALLSGTDVFTGTADFGAATVVGVIRVFHLTSSAITITNLGTNFATSNNSNMWSMPALVASNAHLKITHNASRTSTTTAGGSMSTEGRFFIGNDAASATNLLYYPNLLTGSSLRANTTGADLTTVWGSTNALVSITVAGGTVAYSLSNTNTACTNVNFSLPWVVVLKVNDLSAVATGTNTLTLHYLSIQAEQ